MRKAPIAIVLAACSADRFTGIEAGVSVCATPHELCDDFDKPNEVAGVNPPWTGKQGPVALATVAASPPKSLEAPATLGTYLRWTLPKRIGVTCEGKVWVEPAADRARTIALFELDAPMATPAGTYFYAVTLHDVNGVLGVSATPALTIDSWGSSTAAVPVRRWHPFTLDITIGGTDILLTVQVGPANFSGKRSLPGAVSAARMAFGAGTLNTMFMDVVRWDDIFCDSH